MGRNPKQRSLDLILRIPYCILPDKVNAHFTASPKKQACYNSQTLLKATTSFMTWKGYSQLFRKKWKFCLHMEFLSTFFTYLHTVVCCIRSTDQVIIRPAIQIWILTTDASVTSVTCPTFTFVHWITEMAQIDALRRLMAAVCLVLAWILRFTDL